MQPTTGNSMRITGTVNEILRHKGATVWGIAAEATVFEALELMAEKNIGALLVQAHGKPLGVVAERDYTRKVALRGKTSRETKVGEILSTPMISATSANTVEECMRIMTANRIRHLLVLEAETVVGIVSIGDLVNWIISTQSETINQLESYISGQYPG